MTIKQQGGIFGRNPTFNNVTVDGTLTVDQIAEKTGAAGITLDGVTLKDGNVVLADGKGIDFSATAGTGTSELFDDYEEGTFTPTIVGTTTAGAGTYTTQNGYYTKIGNRVAINIALGWSAHTGTGSMRISGLPFSNQNATGNFAIPSFYHSGLALLADRTLQGFVNVNSTQILLYNVETGGGANGTLAMDSAADIYLSMQYQTAS